MRESSFKCETFEELIFASEPFDVVKGSICWGDRSFESLCHFTRLSVDQHTEGAEERRGLLSEERAGDSNCGKIHPAFGAQFYLGCNISLVYCIFDALHLWCYVYALLVCYA